MGRPPPQILGGRPPAPPKSLPVILPIDRLDDGWANELRGRRLRRTKSWALGRSAPASTLNNDLSLGFASSADSAHGQYT